MQINKRHKLTATSFSQMLLIFSIVGVISSAQSREGFVMEGVSLDSVLIGKSTSDDIVSLYGENYKLINHNGYSYEMIYKELGLSFYYCQDQPSKKIFVIEIEPPFKATTSKGVTLGESTLADVFQSYGERNETSTGFKYEGIYFHYEEDNAEEVSEDARNTPKVKAEKIAVNEQNITRSEEPLGNRIDQSNIILDGVDVSDELKTTSNNNLNNDEDSQEQSDTSAESDDDKKLKTKVVKRIGLIEKSGLRQCSTTSK